MSNKNNNEICFHELCFQALKMYRIDLEKIKARLMKRRQKEIEKVDAEAKEYEEITEDDIQTMYGYGEITEKKRCEMLEKLSKGNELRNEPTVLEEYLKILQNDIQGVNLEIIDIQQNMEKAEMKKELFAESP